MRIDIVVYDGLDELDALGPLEVLRSAEAAGADVTAQLVTRVPSAAEHLEDGISGLPA